MSGARETPRPRYLPNCPRFLYAESGDLAMTLPATLIDYSIVTIGGDAESDSGRRASFVVRRDELYTFTLRFYEEEWPSVQTFIDWAQTGLPFFWYPDADDDGTIFAMQLEAPAVGSSYQAIPDPSYPMVLLLTITISGAQFPVVQTDALLQSELVFMNHFSLGEFQSRYRQSFIDGSFEFFETGGRDGGGCAIALSAAGSNGGGAYLGVDHHPEVNGDIFQGSIISTHDLSGLTLEDRPLVLHNYNHVHVLLMPDYTIRAGRVKNGFGGITWDYLGEPTTFTVPRSGIFTLESQFSCSPTTFHPAGGFIAANLYQAGRPVTGDAVVRAVGVDTVGLLFGSPVTPGLSQFRVGVPQGTKIMGLGIALPIGAKKRWLYDTYFAPAKPYADGVVTESIVSYEHYEEWGEESPGVPLLFGTKVTWGDLQRWRNVQRTNQTPTENLIVNTDVGGGPGLDDIWNSGGPFYPDPDDTARSRNTLVDSALDILLTRLTRPGVKSIEGIGVYHMAGSVEGHGTGFDPILIGGFGSWWNYYGPHPYDYQDDPTDDLNWPLGTKHTAFKTYIQLDDGLYLMCRDHAYLGNPHTWKIQPAGYTLSPRSVLPRNPVTNGFWNPNKLPPVAAQGDTSEVDADEEATARQRWVEVDITQLGLDVAYHKLRIVSQFPNQPPIAHFENSISNHPELGFVEIYDTSVDFNGYFDDVISGIVERIMRWGDGSETLITETGVANPVDHLYKHGTWTATLTVKNAKGLTDTFSREYTVPGNGDAIATFTADPDEYDPLTITFIDTSIVQRGTVVGWEWDLGDGTTFTSQGPHVHTYAAPGTYHVTLTIHGDEGQTDTTEADIVVGDVGGGDCGFSATALADTPWVQGDDYNGGNPPLPAYVNTAAFESWYGATNGAGGGYGGPTFRHEYEFTNGNGGAAGTDYLIDSSVLYNGHPTLKQVIGTGKFGAYHWSDCTDDGDPSETYPPNAALNQPAINGASNYPNSYWMRIIWKAETGIMAAGVSGFGQGLEIVSPQVGTGAVRIMNRQGKIKLETRNRHTSTSGPFVNNTVDVCDETVFIGRSDALFGELIVYYEGDEINHVRTVKVWAGDQCSLVGVSPTASSVDECYGFQDVSAIEMWNLLWSISQADKALWVALWEIVPGAIAANPYGVALS